MKAITLKENGGIEKLRYTDVPTPSIRPGEVLVKVKSIAINPVDAFVRQNQQALQNIVNPKGGEDVVLGWDISGTVVEANNNSRGFKVGDEVFGMVNFSGHGRAYAEYVSAPAEQLALKPHNISHNEAAAATLAALTAWQALVTYAKVKKGEKVLIHAAAGGVGHYAVQIAKHLGAYVIGTASSANKEFVLGIGADLFIDYTGERFEEKAQNVDVVLDSIYGDHLLRSLDVIKQHGRVISLLTFIEDKIAEKVKQRDAFAHRLSVTSNGDDMTAIAQLLGIGAIKSHVSGTYNFAELPKAHQQIETRRTVGKIVVTLQ